MPQNPPIEGLRVALVGNMNNNAFTQMRYLRDMGADAVLFPYATDADGQSAHFAPQADTYQWDKWADHVRILPVPNANQAVTGWPLKLKPPPAVSPVASALDGFDRVLGTGIAPALFERMGRRLDGFSAYSVGIEFFGTPAFTAAARQRNLRGLLHRRVRAVQARGVRKAGVCFNADMGLTAESFAQLGVEFERLPTPMVYTGEDYAAGALSDAAREAARRIESADLSLFCAARHMWVRPAGLLEREWNLTTKHSDWPFRALAEFVSRNPAAKPVLVSITYGPDVAASKRLVAELGIEEFVCWLPILRRREIMALLSLASAGIGEFLLDEGLLWGGTGFEVLAAGRPLLQAFNFTDASFAAQFGYAPPPLLDTKSASALADHLQWLYHNRERAMQTGHDSAQWFEAHAGRGLARQWLQALAAVDPGRA